MRGRLQGLRREIHLEPSAVRAAAGEMSGLQKAGAKNLFGIHHAAQTQAVIHQRRQKIGF